MNQRQKKLTTVIAGGLALLLIAARRQGKGTVLVGPITYKEEKVSLGQVTPQELQALNFALINTRQMLGADPNTFASRQPTAEEAVAIRETLAWNTELAKKSGGSLGPPDVEQKRLALALTLPGASLQAVNAELYALLGVDPKGNNEATLPLTAAREAAARSLIARWRPYSQSAVDTLFVHLDDARALATQGQGVA